MKLSIIIVNYNVRYFLEQALRSVEKASKGLEVETIVVDNNSSDNSVEMVRNKFPYIKLIANQQNTGFSKANNQGIKIAKGEYVLLLNPDTIVEEQSFRTCIEFMDTHPEAGALGVRMIDGTGTFLPESKRGFPSPFVAFCKAFGLSTLFPKSKTFNRYHLGYLDEHETHEVEILSGAYFFTRKKILDEIGYLDEAFFMYGEDIDLSYRVLKAGYKNYYFAGTTILHYKGESTKKGNLNYVKTFYEAMIIFAKKHFTGNQAFVWNALMYLAVFLRGSLALLKSWLGNIALPLLDALLIFVGIYLLKNYWGTTYFNNPNYYPASFVFFNIPLYITIWLGSVYFQGGYDEKYNLRKISSGILFGTILLAAVYGFLNEQYRTSRALIVLSAFWAVLSISMLRLLLFFLKYHHFNISDVLQKRLIIVGAKDEKNRVLELLKNQPTTLNYIGYISEAPENEDNEWLGLTENLEEVSTLFQADELIFCSKDISSQEVLFWMSRLSPKVHFRLVPEGAWSIIGSQSKNEWGELYTVEINYKITNPQSKRNKRLFDFLLSIIGFILLPINLLLNKKRFNNPLVLLQILFGKKSWVGYSDSTGSYNLPPIKKGVFSPILSKMQPDDKTKNRINFLYAKDYIVFQDWKVIWENWK